MSGGVPAGELLPCPFCDSAAISAKVDRKGRATFYRAFCLDCPANTEAQTREAAITAWNTRATPTPPSRDADVERVIETVLYRSSLNGTTAQIDETAREIVAALQALGERGCDNADRT